MSLEIIVGDMFTETLGKDNIIIAHGCNAQGVMTASNDKFKATIPTSNTLHFRGGKWI